MVRMSDILKRIGAGSQDKKPPEASPPESPEKKAEKKTPASSDKQLPEETTPPPVDIDREEAASEGIRLSKAMAQRKDLPEQAAKMSIANAVRETQLDPEESRRIYNLGLALMQKLINSVKNNEPIEIKSINNLVGNIVERLAVGDQELLSLTTASTPDDYLVGHSVNVAILSIEIGLGKGYNKTRLNEIGIASFLHDIGMVKFIEIANQPRILSKDEYNKIEEHTFYGVEILSGMKDISPPILNAIREHHEQINGKGYPQHLSKGQINEYSQIISLCDIYEALTHLRSYRKAKKSHDAIKDILLKNLESHDPDNIKILVKRLGLFPIGSWIELNTGEIGKVISANEKFPLRPNVNVIFDANKQKYPQLRSIDLSKTHSVYIAKSIDIKELGLNL